MRYVIDFTDYLQGYFIFFFKAAEFKDIFLKAEAEGSYRCKESLQALSC